MLPAGLSDGALLLVRNKADPGEPPQWSVSDAIRSFARRHVLQLAVAHSKSMLLSLTEDGGCSRPSIQEHHTASLSALPLSAILPYRW